MIDDKIKRKLPVLFLQKARTKSKTPVNQSANNSIKGRSRMDDFTNDAIFPYNV